MKRLLISILIGSMLAGCAPAVQSAAGVSVPANPALPAATASPQKGASVTNQGRIIVNPPHAPIMAQPVQGGPGVPAQEGWQTYISSSLQVAVDYPAEWSIKEDANGTTIFTSPQGQTILLQGGDSHSTPDRSGQSCATLVTSYGELADTCSDAKTTRYSALFTEVGATAWVMLSTVSHEKPAVYLQMFDTVRPSQ
jgi:hypothetical protein